MKTTKNVRVAILALSLYSAFFVTACSDNACISAQRSQTTSETEKHTGVFIYSGFSFLIIRVEINGVKYLCTNKGGIIRE